MSFEEHLNKLKNGPDESVLQGSLCHFIECELTRVQEFQVVSTVLDVTVPEVFFMVSDATQKLIVRVLQSVSGLGGVVNKIRQCGSAKEGVIMARNYVTVLEKVLNDRLLDHIDATSAPEINEVNKLLFKGGCLAVVNEARENGVEVEVSVLGSTDAFVVYLVGLLARCESTGFKSYLQSVLSFNDNSYLLLFDGVFVEDMWPGFVAKVGKLKGFERKGVLIRLLMFLSRRGFLDGLEKVEAAACILEGIENVDKGIVDKVVLNSDKYLNSLVALCIGNKSQLFTAILSDWGDASLIKSEPITVQESRTHLLIQMVYLQGSSFAKGFLDSPEFLDSVSNRLGSFSSAVKVFALIFADKLCEIGQRDKIFSMDDLEGYEYLCDAAMYIGCKKDMGDKETAWKLLRQPVVSLAEEARGSADPTDEMAAKVQTLSLQKTCKDSDDESSDEDDDDPSIVNKAKISSPMYIKQLIEYLSVNKEHPQAYDMVKVALSSGPTLIRQKAQFGAELESNAVNLLQLLVGLQNDFNESGFEDLKLNCLISVLVSVPNKAVDVIHMLGTGDYSLQQRMMILSGLSLAARDIRGLKDATVTKSFKEKNFATKQLPPQLHAMYLNMESEMVPDTLQAAHLAIQDSLIREESEAAKDQLSGGKILRISRKLTNQQSNTIFKPRFDNYATIISRNFYFPLTHLWYESGGIDIGHYSGLLSGHYIKTLALLLHCSYASASNTDMIREFFIIAHDVVKTSTIDQLQVVEGIVTGILLICDISDEQHLVINFGDYLVAIQAWVSESWEGIIDDRIKSLCAGFLLRITKIFEKYQAFLIDQVNSLY